MSRRNDLDKYPNWWLFISKGTVAEPWPTAEELMNDPEVQEELKMMERINKEIQARERRLIEDKTKNTFTTINFLGD